MTMVKLSFTIFLLFHLTAAGQAENQLTPSLSELKPLTKPKKNSRKLSTTHFAPVPGSPLSFVPVSSPSELPTYSPGPLHTPLTPPHGRKPHHRAIAHPPLNSVLPPSPLVVPPTKAPISASPPVVPAPIPPPLPPYKPRPKAPALPPPLPPLPPPASPVLPPNPPPVPTLPPPASPVLPPNPPAVPTLPPPLPPSPPVGAAPEPSEHGLDLWCVAKPAVPEEKLQEAMNYACGEGQANCEEIMPDGSCYYPDTVLAHASYAFNSYWQQMKQVGGTCDFDGAAVLVTSDPSFQNCRYVLN